MVIMSDNRVLIEMGDRISKQRKSLKLTQEQLADTIGVSTQMISNLELGKKAIRPENLIKICSALGVSADYLLTGVKSDNPYNDIAKKLPDLSLKELALIREIIDYMNTK